jgi:glucokinase
MNVLAGDIGGTNARLAVFAADGSTLRSVREHVYPSGQYDSLGTIVTDFQRGDGTDVGAACFAVAGPVVDGEIKASNLPWVVRTTELAGRIGVARTTLINDFDAVGFGVTRLGPTDIDTLQVGVPDPAGPIALLGAGTGLGQGLVLRERSEPTGVRVVPSEGGHATLAARNEIEWGLAKFLGAEHGGGHVSYERVLSGAGLVAVYQYIVASGLAKEDLAVAAEMKSQLPSAVVTTRGVAGTDAACVQAVQLFASIYGSQAGNVVLQTLSTGGVYLAGGIARRILPVLRAGGFLESFTEKGRMAGLLSKIPVHVITNDMIGLLGAAVVAAS